MASSGPSHAGIAREGRAAALKVKNVLPRPKFLAAPALAVALLTAGCAAPPPAVVAEADSEAHTDLSDLLEAQPLDIGGFLLTIKGSKGQYVVNLWDHDFPFVKGQKIFDGLGLRDTMMMSFDNQSDSAMEITYLGKRHGAKPAAPSVLPAGTGKWQNFKIPVTDTYTFTVKVRNHS